MKDGTSPGVQDIIERVGAAGRDLSPEAFVDRCLELLGFLEVEDDTREGLLSHARADGPLDINDGAESESRVMRMLQLIVSTREYQFA